MDFSILIIWTSLFPIKGLLVFFDFIIQSLIEDFVSKQWRLWSDPLCCIWSGSVLYAFVPWKRMLGSYGLIFIC